LKTFPFRVVTAIYNKSDSNNESNIQFKGKTGIIKRNLKVKYWNKKLKFKIPTQWCITGATQNAGV